MQFLRSIINWYIKKRLAEVNAFIAEPFQTQSAQLEDLLQHGKNTEWGKSHFFQDVKNFQEFKEATPVVNYETIEPWIQRIMAGEQNLMWDSPIKWFAKSSGTTAGRSKFIPVSSDGMESQYTGARDLMAFYLHRNPRAGVFGGKGIVLGGSHKISEFNEHIQYGDLSAVLYKNLHNLPRFLSAISAETAVLEDWDEKLDRIVEETVKKRITNLSGVPTWSLLLIKSILEKTGKECLKEVWPNFELYVSGGVSFVPYENEFRELVGGKEGSVNFLQTYNASEGFFSVQDQLESDEMLLMLDYGIFYEFMPLQEYGKENPKTVELSGVELGKNYAMVITTNCGLWRYLIGDTVCFTSLEPFRIRITGRTRHFINVFGEEVIVDNSDQALAKTCKEFNVLMREYSVGPIFLTAKNSGAHQWVIEFQKEPVQLGDFAKRLDENLRAINSDYDAKRKGDLALTSLQLIAVPKNTFHCWMESKGKLGGQHKVPRLSNDRKYVDGILKYAEAQVAS